MIKHTETQLVSFEDCGFAREPEIPVIGEKVRICCRTDKGENPRLIVTLDGRDIEYEGRKTDDQHTEFEIGPYNESRVIRYRFKTEREESGIYEMNVVTEEKYTRPQSIVEETNGLSVWIARDICCRVKLDHQCVIEFCQKISDLTEGQTCVEWVSEQGVKITAGPEYMWTMSREQEILTLKSVTVWRNCTGGIVRIRQEYASGQHHVWGTGERFDAVDQQGKQTNGNVTEHFTHQGDQTYLPVPFFMTEQGWGCNCNSAIPVNMEFRNGTILMTQETEGSNLAESRILFGNVQEQLKQYMELTGKPSLPPEWAFGVWISGNGWNNDAEVDEQLQAIQRYHYPASVMVLEQWSDERTFHIWHKDHFPDPAATVKKIKENGLHLILWQIPVIKYEWDGEAGPELEQETREAFEGHYAVRYPDGTPYRITERWFHNSLLPDFTNPETVKWWFEKRRYLLDLGVEGFKTDGGEFLFDKRVRLYDGTTGRTAHNLYPLQYEKAYSDFLKDHAVNGVIFSRAGYAGAQTVPIHWAGDQMSEWSELEAQLCAGISAGLSGILFWSFDIGGFAGPIPTAELYLRATAFGCFAPIMQWHSEPRNGQFSGGLGDEYNNDRSPWNIAEKWQCPDVLEIGCKFAGIRENLRAYLWQEAQECVKTGRPMMAHLCIDHPEDPETWKINDEYMLGRELLVAPIVSEGLTGRRVYLPEGQWTDFFTGESYTGKQYVDRVCGLDEIPVFRKECGA